MKKLLEKAFEVGYDRAVYEHLGSYESNADPDFEEWYEENEASIKETEWKEIAKYGHPPMEVPVWLCDGKNIWIGARDWVDSDHWLYGHCYSSYGIDDDGKWRTFDIEFDDDYQPTHWKHLPQLPCT